MSYISKYIGIGSRFAANLENRLFRSLTEREEEMALNTKKIRREVKVDGRNIWITANTEQEYADKLLRVNSKVTDKENLKFKVYSGNWYETFAKPNIAPVTAITYKRQLDLHINPVIGDLDLSQITAKDIQKVFNRMGDAAKQETKNKVKNVLNQIFKMAVEEDLITKNPLNSMSLKIKGEQSTRTEPYTITQMQYLAAHVKRIKNQEDRSWLALSITLPLRPEEVLGLRWKDIDKTAKTLYVRSTVTHPTRNEPVFNTYTKTESSRRELIMPKALIDILPDGEDPDYFVIGGSKPISYTKLRCMRKRIAKEISFSEPITPRRFRTTVATDISAMTHDLKLVQQMLGHSTPQMTLKHYDKGRNTAIDASNAIEQCYGLYD